MHEIDILVADMSALQAPPDTVNMYALDGPPGNAVRRANLNLALQLAVERGPDLLLVGEAPGYSGARRTGVPFTSDRLLVADRALLSIDGRQPTTDDCERPPHRSSVVGRQSSQATNGFRLATDDGRTPGEQTATIVTRELRALGLFAAGWNAFPLHPHRPGDSQSNRPPRAGELALGRPFLARAIALFPGVPVVALGNVAAAALVALGVNYVKLRHPAQGGARAFAEGLRAFAEGLLQVRNTTRRPQV